MNIAKNLENSAFFFPELTALIEDDQRISYRQLNEDANRVATGLISRGGLGVLATFPFDLEFAANALFVDGRIVSNDFDRQAPKLDHYETLDLLFAWRPSFGEHFEGALTLALPIVNAKEYVGFAVRSTSNPSLVVFYPAATRTWEVGFMLTLRR